jgi:hypothetical protein
MLDNAWDDPDLLRRAANYLEKHFTAYLDSIEDRARDFVVKVKKARHWADRLKLTNAMMEHDPLLKKLWAAAKEAASK